MRNIEVCVGSSCFLKGSYRVVDAFKALIRQHGLADSVQVVGAFCVDHCREGVSVRIGEEIYSVPDTETARALFQQCFVKQSEG